MLLIIAHGDGDGVISAAILKKLHPTARVSFARPHTLLPTLRESIANPEISGLIIADIAIDKRNFRKIVEYIKVIKHKILLWIDHHQGTEVLRPILGKKLWFDLQQPSCPAVIAQNGIAFKRQWLKTANACDRPLEYPETFLSDLWNKALKTSDKRKFNELQFNFLNLLLSGNGINYFKRLAIKYDSVANNTIALLKTQKIQDITSKLGFIKLDPHVMIDKRLLFIKAYEKYQFLAIWEQSPNQEYLTITTNRQDINLCNIFDIPSGQPFRIRLTGNIDNLVDCVLNKLKPYIN